MKDHRVIHEAIWAPLIAVAFLVARFFPIAAVPFACPFRSLTSIPCPTCGGTRAMMALARFEIVRAFEMNPLVAALGVVAFAYLLHALSVLITRRPWRPTLPAKMGPALIALFALNWCYLIVVGR